MSTTARTRFGRAFADTCVKCPQQIALYGDCVIANLDSMKKDACAKEFTALKACFQKAVRAQRARR